MRRAALPAIGLLGMARIAAAEPWTVMMESGAEADSNVERVETVDGGKRQPISAPAARAGAHLEHRGYLLDGAYVAGVSGLARLVGSSRTKSENVMLSAGEWRWLRPIVAGSVAAGIHLTAVDAFAVLGGTGARTFRNLGGDALLVLGRGDDHHLSLGIGGRDFSYKPEHTLDWRGPVASARLDLLLWQAADKTANLEFATLFGFEARRYASTAIAGCSPDPAIEDPCTLITALRRRDRFQRAGIEVRWSGRVIATTGYQLTVIDSNSYGQSLVRQRLMAAVTVEPFAKLFASATATLQLDQYPDGLLLEDELEHEVTSLEDENRSSLQIRVARDLSTAWSVEARGAVWRDFANTGGTSFRRELIYVGVVYAR